VDDRKKKVGQKPKGLLCRRKKKKKKGGGNFTKYHGHKGWAETEDLLKDSELGHGVLGEAGGRGGKKKWVGKGDLQILQEERDLFRKDDQTGRESLTRVHVKGETGTRRGVRNFQLQVFKKKNLGKRKFTKTCKLGQQTG